MLFTTAPEWSTGEVLLASAYRRLVLGISERFVDLGNIATMPTLMPEEVGGEPLWSALLLQRDGIASPLKHGQSSPTATRQLMPIVPATARIAGVLGKRPRSRWNPSSLLLEAIGAGGGEADGNSLLMSLGQALEVTDKDDLFARFVEEALEAGMESIAPRPQDDPAYTEVRLTEAQLSAFRQMPNAQKKSPAERFFHDLPAVLNAKCKLTRRQWTVLLEAILRLGLGMHVLWTCRANVLVWELALSAASGTQPPGTNELRRRIWESHDEAHPLLELGSDALPLIKNLIERYAYARTGLNLLLCRLEENGKPILSDQIIGYQLAQGTNAPTGLYEFLSHIHEHRTIIDKIDANKWLRVQVARLFDERSDMRALAQRKSGYTRNLFEFARHSLGQVRTKDPDQRCYDLSYMFAYTDDRKPLLVHPGPAMLLCIVHACCSESSDIPVSLDDLRRHLGEYGLRVPAGELIHGRTGQDLAMLGLVVDSPDAAGGRLLVRPL